MDDDSISSISTWWSIPSFSGPTMGPGTAFLAPQPTTQAEKSVDSSKYYQLRQRQVLLSQTDEDGSGDQTQDMSMQSSSVTSKSSLFSTEAPTATSRLHHLLIQFLPQLDQPLNRKNHHCLFHRNRGFWRHHGRFCPRVNHQSTTFSSLSSTKSLSVTASHETETSDTLKTAITRASSLYSTEKPTSGQLNSRYCYDKSNNTEKSSILSIGEQASATTAQTEKSSVSAITDKTEQSAMVTKADEDGSGEPSISPSSDETLTSSMTSLQYIYNGGVHSFIQWTNLGPGTAFLAPQPTTQAEKSVDSSVDLTAESLLLATTLSSIDCHKSTERLSATPETSYTISKTDEDGSGDQTQDISMQSSSVTSKSSLFSTEAPTATSPVTSSADSVLTSIGSTLKPEHHHCLFPQEQRVLETSRKILPRVTIRATTFSSLSSTKSPSVTASHETETRDTLKTAITRASSLYSTEKPTSGSAKTQDTVTTSLTSKTSATPETSPTFPTLEEESSVKQTTKMSSKDTTVPTSSTLFSTEKSSILSIGEQASATTAQTEKSSVSAITDKTEQSAMVTRADEDGSGDQTSEMYTDISSVINFTKLPSFTGEPSISPSSDETLTSSMTMSPSWASVISSVKEMDDDSISSISTMVESIPSFSGPTMDPGTAFLAPQPTTQAEKSVDSSVDLTAESLLLATTLSSMLNTEIPSVTITSQTERLSLHQRQVLLSQKQMKMAQVTKPKTFPCSLPLSRLNPLCLALRHQLQHLRNRGSGDITDDFAQESTIRATTFSSLSSTKSPSVTASHETETSDTLKTAITRASSLYSTEKPTSGSAKTQDTVTTSLTSKTSATPETSPTFPTLEEESSVKQTTKMSSKYTTVPTSSTLFSTEKSSILSIGEQASATTAQTEKSSVSAITDKTEQSAMVTKADEDGSGDQTSEMYTDISSVIHFTNCHHLQENHPFLHPLMRHSQAQ
ncbi:hypothetical protein F7725_012715 [Dissostichus mawsoni]|uniref:Uncharacterized protein n=1 Tax=Dissostichus mawsoni TaxID=36200 RepID=A0A7J5YP84_DISMA|nr:hypothetical protein F7725_012715 [Dissostichus mawsoni]